MVRISRGSCATTATPAASTRCWRSGASSTAHTFLTKAGHVGVVYRLRGVDVDGLTHAQRRASPTGWRPPFGSWTSGAASISTSSSGRSIRSSRRSCAEPVAQEALNRRTAYLNDRAPDLYQLDAIRGAPLRAARTVQTEHAARRRVWRDRARRSADWLSTRTFAEAAGGRAGRRHRAGSATRPSPSSPSWPTSGWHGSRSADAFRFFRQLGELRPAGPVRGDAEHARRAPRLLRRRLAGRLPSRSPDGRRRSR